MQFMTKSCGSSVSVAALAGGYWEAEPRLDETFLCSGVTGRTSLFGTGVCFAVVMSQTLTLLQVGNLLDVSSWALIGKVICCISFTMRGFGAFCYSVATNLLDSFVFSFHLSYVPSHPDSRVGTFDHGCELLSMLVLVSTLNA